MGDTVFINGRAAVHRGSGGQAVAFPDVCLCPPSPPAGPIPTPLPNSVQAAGLDGGAPSVLVEGNPAGKKSSFFNKSTGNEVAQSTGGGVVSHVVQGKAYFQSYSMNVLIEGEESVRHADLLTHNHAAQPGNTPPAPWMSAMSPPPIAPQETIADRNGPKWIEIRLVDQDKQPVPRARFELKLPDGAMRSGRLDEDGCHVAQAVPEGTCEVRFPDFDANSWTLWDKQPGQPPPGTLTKAVKRTVMPPPTRDHDSKDVHVFTGALFKKDPAYTEIQQAPGIANCPVGSILAAMAFTSVGRADIKRMLSETAGNVVTDLSSLPAGTLTNPPAGATISSSRFFTVKLGGGSVDVSDVLYTDDHDSGWSPFYMRDPSDQSIWAAIIEKALADKLKGYENFDTQDISANDFWEKITGVRPGVIKIEADTPLATITAKAQASTRVPTIGASKENSADVKFVSEFHGFAMLGLQDSKIRLYDAAKAKTILLSPADFRHDFQDILFRK